MKFLKVVNLCIMRYVIGEAFAVQFEFRIIISPSTWWRHQMETFSALLAFCEGNSPVTGEFPSQRPVTLSFGVFFDLRLNKRLSKQSWGWWFETPSCSLWRHFNPVSLIHWSLVDVGVISNESYGFIMSICCEILPWMPHKTVDNKSTLD